jgi:hypothetical protein
MKISPVINWLLAISLLGTAAGAGYAKQTARSADPKALAAARSGHDIKSVSVDGVTFIWAVDRDDLIGMVKSASPGWVAVGFNSDRASQESKLIIGSIAGGHPSVEIQKVSGLAHSHDPAALALAQVTKENNATVVIFRVKMKDLGLEGKSGKPAKIFLARNAESDDISQYDNGTRRAVTVTL